MRWLVVVALIILLVTQINGCLKGIYSPSSTSSMSALPEVIVDYDVKKNVTKIWVKSPIMDYRYDNITIMINNETSSQIRSDNYTYCIDLETTYRRFRLNVSAVSKETLYYFECHVKLVVGKELIFQFEYSIVHMGISNS